MANIFDEEIYMMVNKLKLKEFEDMTRDEIIEAIIRSHYFHGVSSQPKPSRLKDLGHPISGSRPSAEDIHNCGKFKIICTGGKSGNKIGCLTYKGEQISVPEYVRILYDISQGIMKTENPKYQPNVDCINNTLPSYLAEMYITEKLDKDIRDRKSRLSSLRIEERIDLDASEALRYMYDKILKKEMKKQSNKYYNETKIM